MISLILVVAFLLIRYFLVLGCVDANSFNTPVEEIVINKEKAVGIRTKDEVYHAKYIISNADVVPTYRKLLKQQKAPEKTLSQIEGGRDIRGQGQSSPRQKYYKMHLWV